MATINGFTYFNGVLMQINAYLMAYECNGVIAHGARALSCFIKIYYHFKHWLMVMDYICSKWFNKDSWGWQTIRLSTLLRNQAVNTTIPGYLYVFDNATLDPTSGSNFRSSTCFTSFNFIMCNGNQTLKWKHLFFFFKKSIFSKTNERDKEIPQPQIIHYSIAGWIKSTRSRTKTHT